MSGVFTLSVFRLFHKQFHMKLYIKAEYKKHYCQWKF